MSPARLSFHDVPTPEGSLCDSWPPSKMMTTCRTGAVSDLELVDDIRTLWEAKWKHACRRQIHPFQDGHYEDFATIFSKLFSLGITSAHDIVYTETFCQLAQELADNAAQILVEKHPDGPHLAAQHLLRACALLRVARFPYATGDDSGVRNPVNDQDVFALKKTAYALQQNLYVRAMRFWDVDSLAPLEEVRVPHVHDLATHPDSMGGRHFDMGIRSALGGGDRKGARRPHIPMHVRVPLDTLLTGQQCPVMLILSADRTGETQRCEEALARGWAAVVVEVPGMGESPVRRGDGHDAEARLWSSVLDWMRGMYFYDMDRVVVVVGSGLSSSSGPFCGAGPTAARLAESHGSRLKGVVALHATPNTTTTTTNPEQPEIASVQCPLLIASSETPPSATPSPTAAKRHVSNNHGLWTPVTERHEMTYEFDDHDLEQQEEEDDDEEEEENQMKLREYRRDAKGCVAQMRTSDTGKIYGWMEDVMASRETQIRGSELQRRELSVDSKMGLWWQQQQQQQQQRMQMSHGMQWKPPSPPTSETGAGGGQAEKTLWVPRSHFV